LEVVAAAWEGVRHGLLRRRRVRVAAAGRGAAAVPRHAEKWLPGPDGHIAPVHPDAPGLDGPESVTVIGDAHARRLVLYVVG